MVPSDWLLKKSSPNSNQFCFFDLPMNKTMRKLIPYLFLIAIFACGSNASEEACTKTITVQNEFTIQTPTGTTIIPEITQEVSCDFPEPNAAQTIEQLPRLQEFSYEIITINVTPDTGNNTSRIEYSVRLQNLSNALVKGIPYITTRINNQSFTVSGPNTNGCLELGPNSSCILNYSAEESLNVIMITDFVIENVEYLIYNSL